MIQVSFNGSYSYEYNQTTFAAFLKMTLNSKISDRSDINMFRALDMLGKVKEYEAKGINIAKMGAGQPNVGAPKEALDYAIGKILEDPRQGYTEAIGMPILRERIAKYYNNYYGVEISPDNIVITTGSSGGFVLNFLASLDAGDKIALTTPTYPAYRNILKSLNIKTVEVEARVEDNYQPTVELLESIPEKFDGLIITSPSNPCGTMISDNELEKICTWCDKNKVRLISDEAYHGITYDKKAQTALKYSKNAVVLNTFSKYFAMTGWRLGWSIVPDNMINRVKKLSENLCVSPPTISQHLAYKIFDHIDKLDIYVEGYRKNREILLNDLPKTGITEFTNADGAFYVYADISKFSDNSIEFCSKMLEEARVATTPGVDFDLTRGHKSIRICYADSEKNIIEALQRLKGWLS